MRDRARALERERKSLARWSDKKRLREIKQKLREARRQRPERYRSIRALCRVGRENVRARIALLREETRAALKRRVTELREAQRGDCRTTEAAARAALEHEVGSAHAELEQHRAFMQREYGKKRFRSRVTASERHEESDDEVRRNLPAELVPVFNRVRNVIHAGPRHSRTEAFLEWVEDNPDEAHGVLYETAERDVQRLIAEQEAVERRLGSRYDEESAHAALASGEPF